MMLCLLVIWASAHFLPGSGVSSEIYLQSNVLSVFQDVRQQTASNSEQKTSGQSDSERLVAANGLYNQATEALQNGELNRAADKFREALAIHRELAPLSLELARDLNGLADINSQRGESKDAQECYEQALAILKKVAPGGLDSAHSLYGLGRTMADRFDWDQAGEHLKQALSLRQMLEPQGLETAAILNSLSDWYRRRMEPVKAEQALGKALAIEEAVEKESLPVADTLTRIGILAARSDPKKSEMYLRRGLALREKFRPDSLAVANSFWWLGVCTTDPAKKEEYHRKAAEIQKVQAPGGIFLAQLLNSLAYPLESRGDLAKAVEYEQQSLAIAEKQAPGSILVSSSLEHLGRMFLRQGELEKAETALHQAFQIAEKLQPGGYDAAENLSSLGDLYLQRGDLDTAEQHYRRALKLREKLDPDGPLYSNNLRSLGFVAYARGDLDNAEQYHRQALVIREKFLPESIEVANSLSDLGSVAIQRGDLMQAEQYQQKALKIWEKHVPGSLYIAQGNSELGRIAQQQGNLANAEAYQRRALNIWEKLIPRSSSVAFGLSSLGKTIRDRGDPRKAEEYARRALAIEEKQAPGGPLEAFILLQLGGSIEDQGHLALAEECYRRSLVIREKYASGTTIHAETLAALAANMRRQNRWEEATRFYEQSLAALEAQTTRLGGDQEIRSGFRATYAYYYKDYIDLLLRQNNPEVAFQVSERFRARSLLETLSAANIDIHTGVDSGLVERKRSLQQSVAAKADRRLRMLGDKHSDQQLAAITGEIDELLRQYKDVERQLEVSSPSYAALTQPNTLNARQVQEQLLDADTLLLEYSLGKEHSYLFKVDQRSVAAYELPRRDGIEQQARRLYELLTIRNHAVKGETALQRQARVKKAETEFSSVAKDLSQMVLGPIAADLSEKRLLIVSDGALQYIPFAVLPDLGVPAGPKSPEPLLVRHEIVSLPSASVLAILRREELDRKPASNEVIAFADPVFEKQDPRVEGHVGTSAHEKRIPFDHLTRSLEDIGGSLRLSRLPFSRIEANAIMAVTPRGKASETVDFRANRTAVTSSQLAQYRIVHFATHGLLDSKNPELSGLVMSMVDEQGHSQNGFLDLQDIYNLRLPVELVVLSACETGLGKEVSGEGLIGLTRGFMFAGASRVVASLWNVSDVATAKLMEQFYKGMEQDHLSPAAALRKAQVNLWSQRRWSDSYYWAAFQIQGEWK